MYGTSYIGLRLFLEKYGLQDRVRVERTGYTQIPILPGDRIEGAVCFFNAVAYKVLEATCTLFYSPEGCGFMSEKIYQDSLEILFRLGMIDRIYPAGQVLRNLR